MTVTATNITTTPAAPSGWRCPQCGRVWAPHVDRCLECEKGAAPAPAKDLLAPYREVIPQPTYQPIWRYDPPTWYPDSPNHHIIWC